MQSGLLLEWKQFFKQKISGTIAHNWFLITKPSVPFKFIWENYRCVFGAFLQLTQLLFPTFHVSTMIVDIHSSRIQCDRTILPAFWNKLSGDCGTSNSILSVSICGHGGCSVMWENCDKYNTRRTPLTADGHIQPESCLRISICYLQPDYNSRHEAKRRVEQRLD